MSVNVVMPLLFIIEWAYFKAVVNSVCIQNVLNLVTFLDKAGEVTMFRKHFFNEVSL